MLYPAIVSFFCIMPSLLLMLVIERSAMRLWGGPVPRWQRILIPLPIFFLLVANLDGVLSLLSYLNSHPGLMFAARYDTNQSWSTDRFFYAGCFSIGLLPFVIAPTPFKGFRLLPIVWLGHVLCMMFPYAPFLLASGVPLQD